MEVGIRASSHLSPAIPASGKVTLEEASRVSDLLDALGISSDLVMLVVVDGTLGDFDTQLNDGSTVELIAPVSGG